MTGVGTTASPFQADGLSIDVSGYTAATGDRFIIKPTANAVAGLQVLVTDPSKIAAAAPIVASAAATNTGGASITAGTVLGPTNAQLRTTATIQFLTPTTYSVNGAGNFTYTSGGNIDVNGWRVQITGTPAVGDTFTVADNTSGVGDNRNALKLANIVNQPVLNNGKTSINDAAGQFIGDIGVKTNQAQISRDAQKTVHDDSVSAQQAVSGVNLDEEAANLLKYQQAYQAAAQIIKIAQTLFDTLIQAARV
jgi:flagellar hook-associated protein 1 FlgK